MDQQISTRLLRLACRVHDPVQRARLQLTQEPLCVAAQTHSARAQVVSPTDNSTEHLISYLQDPKSVRLLAEKTREIWKVSYIDGVEECVTALAMLLLVVEEKISAPASVVVEGISTKRSCYNSMVEEALSTEDASSQDFNERRKAKVQLLNRFGVASWRDHNIDWTSLSALLNAPKVGDASVTNMLLMGNIDDDEADPERDTEIYLCRNFSSSTKKPRIVWLLLKNGAGNFHGNIRDLTPVQSTAAKRSYKALQDCVTGKNGSMSFVKPLLHFGANTKV